METVFRPALPGEAERCAEILQQAKVLMHKAGNFQWTDTYPSLEDVRADINAGNGYVVDADGQVVAYGAVVYSGEPAYEQIQGQWLSNGPYVVVHRMAVAMEARHQGIAQRYFQAVEKDAIARGVRSFRIDTNAPNVPMRALIKKQGFCYCGIVYYNHGERLAYEKLL